MANAMQDKKPTRIFISYRWDYSYEEASALQREITARFEQVSVFWDAKETKPGELLTKNIIDALDENPIVLALLHKDWQIKPPVEEGSYLNKLFKPNDWVFMELDYARNERNLRVIPVLCHGAKLPARNKPDEIQRVLPEKLQFLTDDLLALPFDKANGNEEAVLRFLKKEFHLTEKTDAPSEPLVNCLKEEGLDLPNILPARKDVPLPYLGLPHYEEKHARLFFGRNDDILALWNLVERKPERLLLLYGYSGVGKSSLLHAGLFPRMQKKEKGWTVLAARRQKGKSLEALFEALLADAPDSAKTLIAIDQLEEALIEPEQGVEELSGFLRRVKSALKARPGLRVLLGFRKEFLPEMQEQVVSEGLDHKTTDYFLKPLSDEGIREAIALDGGIRSHYGYEMADGLADEIADGIIERGVQAHSGEISSKAPWLQLLLLNLWQAAQKEQGELGLLRLEQRHLHAVRRDTFPLIVESQLAKMAAQPWPHRELYDNGLTLDLLACLTTAGGTAAIRADEELRQRYACPPEELTAHLRLLENLQLVTRISSRTDQPFTRLAHDALAPVIRQRFDESNLPAQRGHRILAGKKTGDGAVAAIRDKDDIAILRAAKPFMCCWSEAEEAAFAEGERAIAQAEAELREKTAYVFDSFANLGLDLIYTLDHEQALEKFQVAIEVPLDFDLKKQKLTAPAEELFYFFAAGGRQPDKARIAAQLLLELQPDEALRAGLEQCIAATWERREQFALLLPKLTTIATLEKRYYPEMVRIEGGAFKMGSPEKESGRYSDELQHKVKLASFRMATTTVTFFQFALYCEATGKSIVSRTPSWGRRGDHPLVNVSWYDAVEFCNWLSLQCGLSPCYELLKQTNSDENNQVPNDYLKWKVETLKGTGYRLPTNAEWEYAARGGNRKQAFRYAGSNEIEDVAWYWENSGDKRLSGEWDANRVLDNNCRTHRVGAKNHNGIGLYDMSGNVWEWCRDWYQSDYYEHCKSKGVVENPEGPESSNSGRVLRGGSWLVSDDLCRVAYRYISLPDYSLNYFGFRLAQDS